MNIITNIPQDGLIIDKPGTYHLIDNIDFTPIKENSFAIIIASNNVYLKGKNNCIIQTNSLIKHCFGIQIKSHINNVEVSNLSLKNITGGGIWVRGGNSHILFKKIKMRNCGYHGLTLLDQNGIVIHDYNISKIPTAFSSGLFLDGGYNNPIKNVEIVECDFFETGINRETNKYELSSTGIFIYQSENILIKNCSVDGVVGLVVSFGVTLVAITNIIIDDMIICDVYSSRRAEEMFKYDIGGKIKDLRPTSIFSNIDPKDFINRLDDHGNRDYVNGSPNPIHHHNTQPVTACHIKNVIPHHKENEEIIAKEHVWRELRTLYRLVSYNSDIKSNISAKYAKWVEMFCEHTLKVKVRVIGGFANLYENGNTILPHHRDAYGKWVFGLSFGETRTLEFVNDSDPTDVTAFELSGGDIFIFSPDINYTHQHRMRAEPERKGRRVNLTYFLEIVEGDSNRLTTTPDIIENIPTF